MNGCVACGHNWEAGVLHDTDCPKYRDVAYCGEWVGSEDRCGSDAVICRLNDLDGLCADHLPVPKDPWGSPIREDVETWIPPFIDWTIGMAPGEVTEMYGR